MDLTPYVDPRRVITIDAGSKAAALEALVDAIVATAPALDRAVVFGAVMDRERVVSTRVAHALGLPHARLPGLAERCYIAVGRCPAGIDYEDGAGEPVRILTMVLVRDDEPGFFLEVLAELARILDDPGAQERILAATEPADVVRLFLPGKGRPETTGDAVSAFLVDAAAALADRVDARAVVVNWDALPSAALLAAFPLHRRLIVVGRRVELDAAPRHPDLHLVHVPATDDGHTRQVRLQLLFCLSRGILAPTDTVVCVTGLSDRGVGDTLVVTRVDRECHVAANAPETTLSGDVRAEVLERVIELACEIAREGREGHPVGTVFVLGDAARVQALAKQLIINPFHGHPEDSRNILDPTLAETIKEFAGIDGAYVIRGDGVVLSAGTYLRATDLPLALAGGLGARHQAAAAITAATDALAVAVSASTGAVTIYKRGATLTVIERDRRR